MKGSKSMHPRFNIVALLKAMPIIVPLIRTLEDIDIFMPDDQSWKVELESRHEGIWLISEPGRINQKLRNATVGFLLQMVEATEKVQLDCELANCLMFWANAD